MLNGQLGMNIRIVSLRNAEKRVRNDMYVRYYTNKDIALVARVYQRFKDSSQSEHSCLEYAF